MLLLLFSIIYAIPNIYSEDPAIQITGNYGNIVNNKIVKNLNKILEKEKIIPKSSVLNKKNILFRFNNVDTQLSAKNIINKELGQGYTIALNLAPTTPKWLNMINAKPMKLGLDLKGGIHFLMEVNIDNIIDKIQNENINNIKKFMINNNINYSKIYKNNKNNIIINFPKNLIQNNLINYLNHNYQNLLIINNSNNVITIALSNKKLKEINNNSLQQNINILRNRINQLGIADYLVQKRGNNFIIVELPGIQDTALAKSIIGATVTLELRLVNNEITNKLLNSKIPSNSEIKFMSNGQAVLLYKKNILTGDHIITASYGKNEYNFPQVNVELDQIGGDIIYKFTKNNIGKFLAILLTEYKTIQVPSKINHFNLEKREEIINIANIQSPITNKFIITGINNNDQAKQLAILLRSGSLIAPMKITEEHIIGPTMGEQNIKRGIHACFWSLIIPMIFIISYYKIFGVICSISLIINLIIIVCIMSVIPGTTLTMSGIAGIVLTVAIAVDANVLINERIKEELKHNKSIQQSIYKGYKNAYSSVIDANLVNLVVSIILYGLGNGAIKSFAITLIIGIISSIITSLIVTRAFVNLLYGNKNIKKISI